MSGQSGGDVYRKSLVRVMMLRESELTGSETHSVNAVCAPSGRAGPCGSGSLAAPSRVSLVCKQRARETHGARLPWGPSGRIRNLLPSSGPTGQGLASTSRGPRQGRPRTGRSLAAAGATLHHSRHGQAPRLPALWAGLQIWKFVVFLRLLGHTSSCGSSLTGCGPTPDSQTTKNPHTARCLLTHAEEMRGRSDLWGRPPGDGSCADRSSTASSKTWSESRTE